MQDISGFGLRVIVKASSTFPAGVELTQFADDADPLDTPSMQVADKAMGVNGDMVVWSAANPIEATLSLVPNGTDDRNMATLFENNRPAKGKRPARDVITLTAYYPDGRIATMSGGKITDGMPLNSVASAGRMKSKEYKFAFEGLNWS